MVQALAAPQLAQHLQQLARAVRRRDQRDRLAARVLAPASEQPLRPGVPGANHPVERHADDRVLGRLDDRRPLDARPLPPAVLGHVAEDQDGADDLLAGVTDGGGAALDRPLAAVAGD